MTLRQPPHSLLKAVSPWRTDYSHLQTTMWTAEHQNLNSSVSHLVSKYQYIVLIKMTIMWVFAFNPVTKRHRIMYVKLSEQPTVLYSFIYFFL